jgi:hypothetical protein
MPPPAACIPHVPPPSPLRPHFPPSQPTSSTHPPTHCTTTGTLAALWHPTPLCTPQPPPCGAARSVIFSAPKPLKIGVQIRLFHFLGPHEWSFVKL